MRTVFTHTLKLLIYSSAYSLGLYISLLRCDLHSILVLHNSLGRITICVESARIINCNGNAIAHPTLAFYLSSICSAANNRTTGRWFLGKFEAFPPPGSRAVTPRITIFRSYNLGNHRITANRWICTKPGERPNSLSRIMPDIFSKLHFLYCMNVAKRWVDRKAAFALLAHVLFPWRCAHLHT